MERALRRGHYGEGTKKRALYGGTKRSEFHNPNQMAQIYTAML